MDPDISIINGDDFYQHLSLNIHEENSFDYKYQSYFDTNMFIENILLPVKNLKEIKYKKYDWIKKTFSEHKSFFPTNIVFFEGVFMCSPDLVKYFDLSVFLDSKRDLSYDRLIKRDSSQEWITEWQDTEDWYFEHYSIKTLVDILVDVN
jgi:uridine kinase